MSELLPKALQIKINGKYVFSAKEVARHHGVHQNAVYFSRKNKKNPDKLDKLMLFDKVIESNNIADCENDSELTLRGSKEGLLATLNKVMDDDKYYVVLLNEEGDGDGEGIEGKISE